jgi:hypothetical protein
MNATVRLSVSLHALAVGLILVVELRQKKEWPLLTIPTVGICRYHTGKLARPHFHHGPPIPPRRHRRPRRWQGSILPP